MRDKVFGQYDKCPRCGKSKGLYYILQKPMVVRVTMNGKPFIFTKDNIKKTRLSNGDMARHFRETFGAETECAVCVCDLCGWDSQEEIEI